MPAQPKQRDADECRERRSEKRSGCEREQRIDSRFGIEEALVGVETDREQSRRVGADEEERALPERNLARETHQQREPDRDEGIHPHPVVAAGVEGAELEREPAGEDRGGRQSAEAGEPRQARAARAHVASSPRERHPIRISTITRATAKLY